MTPSSTDANTLVELAARVEAATGPDRGLDTAIMFDLFAKPVGQHKADGGPTGYLWPEDNASWSFGHRFPGKDREWFTSGKKRGPISCPECGFKEARETLVIERDGAFVLMNELRIPRLTASLDAAMTLVPDGWEPWDLNKGARWHFSLDKQGGKYPIVDGHADTWALAICAAALRARAAAESAR